MFGGGGGGGETHTKEGTQGARTGRGFPARHLPREPCGAARRNPRPREGSRRDGRSKRPTRGPPLSPEERGGATTAKTWCEPENLYLFTKRYKKSTGECVVRKYIKDSAQTRDALHYIHDRPHRPGVRSWKFEMAKNDQSSWKRIR
jgi:hypothetical protein